MSDWIEWNGGDCPVAADDLLDVCFKDGTMREGVPAKMVLWNWASTEAGLDITAYRLHAPDAPKTNSDPLKTKQERYTDENDQDLIDRWAERYTIEEFRVLMWAMIEKYNERLGKKDVPANEVRKIADYAARWLEVEEDNVWSSSND